MIRRRLRAPLDTLGIVDNGFDKVAVAISHEDAWLQVSSRQLNGPATLAVVLSDHHPSDERFVHVDVGLVLNRNNPASPIVWDCVGFPRTDGDEWLAQSVGRWRATAFEASFGLISHSSDRVDHRDAGDPEGLEDYHCVVTPGIVWGVGRLEALAEWAANNSVLPVIDDVVRQRFFHPVMNTLKIVYGGGEDSEVVDVQINGEFDPHAAELVAGLPWPRVEATWVKSYAICTAQIV